jgi:iron(III) transport system permease protein
MDMAARTLGHGPMAAFFKVHLPLIRGGVLIAVLVVFVDCMKELPATLILRPFNFDTLATYVYQFASDELIEQASLGALGIVVAGLIPVVVLSRVITATRQTQTV